MIHVFKYTEVLEDTYHKLHSITTKHITDKLLKNKLNSMCNQKSGEEGEEKFAKIYITAPTFNHQIRVYKNISIQLCTLWYPFIAYCDNKQQNITEVDNP